MNERDKEEILNFFKEKYKLEVIYATFHQIQEKGVVDRDTMSLDGMLLKIDKFELKFNRNVYFKGSKYHSGSGAVGVEGKVHYKDNK